MSTADIAPPSPRPTVGITVAHLTKKFANAVRVFGQPDFVHVAWDIRARFGGELDLDHDRIVFAKGTFDDVPIVHSFDDSAVA